MKLALNGGTRTRTAEFPKWPVYDKREEEALYKVLESCEWGTLGPLVEVFEKKFSRYTGVKESVAVCNGTVSLEIILRALDIGYGDEVIVPAYTFFATASAVLMVNATPVFVDIHPSNNCIDPDKIENHISNNTKAIIPVHMAGTPADMDRIGEIAEKHGLLVIEDAAQAHGSEWKGRKIGSLGIAGSFSFQSSKNMTAGEGGIITTNDEETAGLCWSIHNAGRKKGEEWYKHYELSGNYRMTEWQAAVLSIQLDRLDKQIAVREDNASYLSSRLKQIPGIEIFEDDIRITKNTRHLYMFNYIKNEFNGIKKEKFIEALEAEGIHATGGYVPLYKQPLFHQEKVIKRLGGNIDYSSILLPQTEKAADQTVWLGQNMLLGRHCDMDDIAEAILKICNNIDELF
jgi:dTDP-4-amino-4,6-dideoxygalactose transaminase